MSVHVYLSTDASERYFNYRGELGVNDDPAAFARRMSAKRLRVIYREDAAPGTGKNIPRDAFGVQI